MEKSNRGLWMLLLCAAAAVSACNSGTSGGNTQPPAQQVYIADFAQNGLQQCSVANNGILANCASVALESNLFNNPAGVVINKGTLYINNSGFTGGRVESSVVQCELNASTAVNCSVHHPMNSSGEAVLYYPIGITFYNNYVYLANWGNNDGTVPPSYAQCLVNNGVVNWNNCLKVGLSVNGSNMPADGTPEVVVFNNGYGYVTDQQDDGYVKCDVSSASGVLSNCQFSKVDQISVIKAVGPRSLMFHNGYAYFANSGYHGGLPVSGAVSSYSKCSVNGDGSLSSCSTFNIWGLNSPTALVYNNGYVYITNEQGPGYSYTQCSINSANGNLENCATNISGNSSLSMPAYTYMVFNN